MSKGTIHTVYRFARTNLQSGGKPVQTAEIAHRDVPRDDASNIGYLWLAYGSGCYFDSQKSNRLAPLWIQDDPALDKAGFTMEATWERDENERLPRQVVYHNDGMKRVQRGGASVVEPWPPPFDAGFRHAIYEASNGTNLGGVFVPTEFTFTRNGIRPNGKGGFDLAVVTHTEVMATTVKEVAKEHITMPSFSDMIGITDYRWMQTNPVTPLIRLEATNGVWPDDELARKTFDRTVRIHEKLNKSRQTSELQLERRWAALGLLAFSSIGSLIVLCWFILRRR